MDEKWIARLSYELHPPNSGRSICQYMVDVRNEYAAMRAYMEWVIHHYYKGILSLWAVAEQVRYVGERTMTVCYEDLVSSKQEYAIRARLMVDFLFNSTENHKPWNDGDERSTSNDARRAEKHSTSHNSTYHEHLLDVIREIDREYYNGDIEWLDSVLPC